FECRCVPVGPASRSDVLLSCHGWKSSSGGRKRRMKSNAESVATGYSRRRSQLSGKHGLIEGLAPARPDGGKHERVLLGRPALSTPFVDGPAHCFRNRNPA